jgi:primosomal protein N''
MTIDTELEVTRLREALAIANLTIGQLKAAERDDQGSANSWLQRKVAAQAKALTRLNERVSNQRFTLRTIEQLGRGLSSDELARAREDDAHTVVLVGAR